MLLKQNDNPLNFKTMKTKLTILFLLLSGIIMAQDVIITKKSERIDAKIEEVSNEQIKYRKTNNLNGPLFIIPTSEIQTVLYENGDVQIFDIEISRKKKPIAVKPITELKEPIEKKKTTHERIDIKHWFGLSAGWVLKDKFMNAGDVNLYDDYSGNMIYAMQDCKVQSLGNTLQVGFIFAPTFGKYNLGLYTGLFFEHTWAMKQITTWNPGINSSVSNSAMELENGKIIAEEEPMYNGVRIKWFGAYENSLYLPIHFQYKYNFNPNMNIYVSIGPSFEFGLDEYDGYSSSSFDYYTKSKINVLIGGKCGFQLYGAQISLLTEWGVTSSKYYDITAHYHRPISIQLSYMF